MSNDFFNSMGDFSAFRQTTAEQLSQLMGAWMNGGAAGVGQANPFAAYPYFAANPMAEMVTGTFFKPWMQQGKPVIDPAIMQSFAEGLKAYQSFPAARSKQTPSKILWQQGTTALRDYGNDNSGAPAILVIPSLINRYDILDLAPEHSFLRFLAMAGFRPFVIDWGSPGEEERNFAISDYVMKRIVAALDFMNLRVRGGRVHAIGYCMGGLLALALASLRPDYLESLLLLATPWNFAAAGTPFAPSNSGEMFLSLANQIEPYLTKEGCFPAEALRLFFASVQPQQLLDKFAKFSGLDPSSPEAERFVLSEDWLNDGVPLSAPVARECLREWYGENRPGKILWRVAGTLVDPRMITCPTYIVAPGNDKLVPPESVRPLARLIRGSTLHEPSCGHIGLLAGHAAPRDVWAPLVLWLLRR